MSFILLVVIAIYVWPWDLAAAMPRMTKSRERRRGGLRRKRGSAAIDARKCSPLLLDCA